jgi:hypothetical protein
MLVMSMEHGDRTMNPGVFPRSVVLTLVFLAGCGDKAQANFAKCVQLDTTGDQAGAIAACTAAIGDDPNSVSGKAAADKIASIKAKEKAEADANAAVAQQRPARAAPAPPPAAPVADDTPAPPASGPCSSIQLAPLHASIFSIVSASGGADSCELIIQTKRPIPRFAFDWVLYDKDGVKLGQKIELLRGLGAGEKAKLSIQLDDGTVKIVSKPR